MAATFLQANSSTADATAYTFSNENLGVADANRHIICAVFHRATAIDRTLSSVTIGGVTATISAEANANDSPNSTLSAIVIAKVPSGTTGDVVVTFSGGVIRCGIALYRVVLASVTASDSEVDETYAVSTSVTIDVPAIGILIATSGGGTTSDVWSGVTEDYSTNVEGGVLMSGGSAEYLSGSAAQVVTCTFGGGSLAIGCAVAWQQSFVAGTATITGAMTATMTANRYPVHAVAVPRNTWSIDVSKIGEE